MTPLVEQPEFCVMQVHSEVLEAHAAGIFLQELGVQAIAELSYESEQYSPLAQVAVPHLTAVGVVGGVVVLLAGQSDANPVEFAISSHVLPSRHVSWSAVGLALQT